MGVPEFWRYNGQTLRIYQLQDGEYIEVENSPTFAWQLRLGFINFWKRGNLMRLKLKRLCGFGCNNKCRVNQDEGKVAWRLRG